MRKHFEPGEIREPSAGVWLGGPLSPGLTERNHRAASTNGKPADRALHHVIGLGGSGRLAPMLPSQRTALRQARAFKLRGNPKRFRP